MMQKVFMVGCAMSGYRIIVVVELSGNWEVDLGGPLWMESKLMVFGCVVVESINGF
jgi:hypothetical protein